MDVNAKLLSACKSADAFIAKILAHEESKPKSCMDRNTAELIEACEIHREILCEAIAEAEPETND